MIHRIISLCDDDPSITLTTYAADDTSLIRDAILVIPGGGYGCVCDDREGEPIALAYLARGMNAFVLKYSIGERALFPRPLVDASLAMAYIRSHADEYHINPNRIFCVGFSAGGHLAASLGTFWHLDSVTEMAGIPYGMNKPAGMILCYAVLTAGDMAHKGSFYNILGTESPTEEALDRYSIEKHIDERTVPAFLMHTTEDTLVPVENALYTAEALSRQKILFEMHIYPRGPHGAALFNAQTSRGEAAWEDEAAARWIDDSVDWMRRIQ